MQAVVVATGDVHVEERPDPVPGDTEVLVAVHVAGLNGADVLQRAGRYPPPPGVPTDIPGLEMAGEVVATGSKVTAAAVGDRVMAVLAGAGQATMAVVDESHLLAVPPQMPWEEAGGFPEVFSTAYDALFPRGHLSAGDRLLVTGAAGGVGVAAVQLGAAAGARVVASVRDPGRREEVAALGAHEVIGTEDIEDHGPYDVVLELVGAASLPRALGALALEARVVVIGVGSGSRVELDIRTLMGARATLGAATLRARSRTEKAVVAAGVRAHVLPLVADGRVRVPVCDRFPLVDAPAAYERFTSGNKLGKVVLVAR
jgi:NADPH:quinone reductase-like Zn-dependent oxidoreductase